MSVCAIYQGSIRHRRLRAPEREFRYRLALAYIDLEELPTLLGGSLLAARPGMARFRRRDYLGDERTPLARTVRDLVAARTGVRPTGSIRLLANLSTFGHCFNPVSFYYCMDQSSECPQAVLAEVTNTPWGERHSYVLARGAEPAPVLVCGAEPAPVLEGVFDKSLHVSPFMGMDARYEWRLTAPGETLSVHIASSREGLPLFDATLSMRRQELTSSTLARMCARYPAPALRSLALIYGQALRLKLRGAPTYPHPEQSLA